MKIDVKRAMQYIYDRFALSGEAARMCENLFLYIDNHDVLDPASLILDVLDGFGFNAGDYSALCQNGAFN